MKVKEVPKVKVKECHTPDVAYAVARCLAARYVTFVYCVETAKDRLYSHSCYGM